MIQPLDFEGLLRDTIGLDAASLGSSAVTRAVQRRQTACLLADRHAYWMHVRGSASELQELVEAVVVPETWFFRDPMAFTTLAQMARTELVAHPSRQELRLLSLPCSSGEEPFSMAMALIDAGIPPYRFRIDAVDISLRALEQAARATYGANSFRGTDLEFRARHFDNDNGRWQPHASVRQAVRFQQGNLFAADFLAGRAHYDYIFCRNVVIYFDQPTQARTLEILLRLLSPTGCLFVGPSETGLLPRDRLASAQVPMAFAFRRVAPADSVAADARTGAKLPVSVRPPLPQRASVRSRVAAARITPPAAPAGDIDAAIANVQELANAGRLPEAAAAGEQALQTHGPSARTYCLLGLIREGAGQADGAAGLYRKALYLEPDHRETLIHLSLLLEKQGKRSAARVLRERLQRVEAQATQ